MYMLDRADLGDTNPMVPSTARSVDNSVLGDAAPGWRAFVFRSARGRVCHQPTVLPGICRGPRLNLSIPGLPWIPRPQDVGDNVL
jgi:hypothetical protein